MADLQARTTQAASKSSYTKKKLIIAIDKAQLIVTEPNLITTNLVTLYQQQAPNFTYITNGIWECFTKSYQQHRAKKINQDHDRHATDNQFLTYVDHLVKNFEAINKQLFAEYTDQAVAISNVLLQIFEQIYDYINKAENSTVTPETQELQSLIANLNLVIPKMLAKKILQQALVGAKGHQILLRLAELRQQQQQLVENPKTTVLLQLIASEELRLRAAQQRAEVTVASMMGPVSGSVAERLARVRAAQRMLAERGTVAAPPVAMLEPSDNGSELEESCLSNTYASTVGFGLSTVEGLLEQNLEQLREYIARCLTDQKLPQVIAVLQGKLSSLSAAEPDGLPVKLLPMARAQLTLLLESAQESLRKAEQMLADLHLNEATPVLRMVAISAKLHDLQFKEDLDDADIYMQQQLQQQQQQLQHAKSAAIRRIKEFQTAVSELELEAILGGFTKEFNEFIPQISDPLEQFFYNTLLTSAHQKFLELQQSADQLFRDFKTSIAALEVTASLAAYRKYLAELATLNVNLQPLALAYYKNKVAAGYAEIQCLLQEANALIDAELATVTALDPTARSAWIEAKIAQLTADQKIAVDLQQCQIFLLKQSLLKNAESITNAEKIFVAHGIFWECYSHNALSCEWQLDEPKLQQKIQEAIDNIASLQLISSDEQQVYLMLLQDAKTTAPLIMRAAIARFAEFNYAAMRSYPLRLRELSKKSKEFPLEHQANFKDPEFYLGYLLDAAFKILAADATKVENILDLLGASAAIDELSQMQQLIQIIECPSSLVMLREALLLREQNLQTLIKATPTRRRFSSNLTITRGKGKKILAGNMLWSFNKDSNPVGAAAGSSQNSATLEAITGAHLVRRMANQ